MPPIKPAAQAGVGPGVFVGSGVGSGVDLGGRGVIVGSGVGGTAVSVGGMGVSVGGTDVSVGRTAVSLGWTATSTVGSVVTVSLGSEAPQPTKTTIASIETRNSSKHFEYFIFPLPEQVIINGDS